MMNKLTAVTLAFLLIIAITACGGLFPTGDDSHSLEQNNDHTPMPENTVSAPETASPDLYDDGNDDIDTTQIPSIDINDYFDVIYSDYEVEFYRLDLKTNDWNLQELPLYMLGAYYLGTDGAYSYGASYELRDRFIANPDEMLEYITLVGENTLRGESVKSLLCSAIVSMYFFDDSDIPFTDSMRTILDDLEEKYKFQSTGVTEVVIILKNTFERNLEEFNN